MKRVLVGYANIYQQTSRAVVPRESNVKAYAGAQAATLVANNQAFNFANTDRHQKWLAVPDLVQLLSHDATVLAQSHP